MTFGQAGLHCPSCLHVKLVHSGIVWPAQDDQMLDMHRNSVCGLPVSCIHACCSISVCVTLQMWLLHGQNVAVQQVCAVKPIALPEAGQGLLLPC